MYHVIYNSLDRKGDVLLLKYKELQNYLSYRMCGFEPMIPLSASTIYPMLWSISLPTTVIAQEDEGEDDEDEESGDMDEEGTDTTVPQMFQY